MEGIAAHWRGQHTMRPTSQRLQTNIHMRKKLPRLSTVCATQDGKIFRHTKSPGMHKGGLTGAFAFNSPLLPRVIDTGLNPPSGYGAEPNYR